MILNTDEAKSRIESSIVYLKSCFLKQQPSTATYDFSTLYTTLEHKDLKYRLHKLFSYIFNEAKKNRRPFLIANSTNAMWVTEEDFRPANGKYMPYQLIDSQTLRTILLI